MLGVSYIPNGRENPYKSRCSNPFDGSKSIWEVYTLLKYKHTCLAS